MLAASASAVDLGGSVRLGTGTTEAGGVESDEEEQAFQLRLTQELSPYLTLFGSFQSSLFRTRFAGSDLFERSSEQPEIGLSYDRSRLNARLVFADRAVRTTTAEQALDIRTFLASLDWRPRRGPRMGFQLRDSTSTADAALFGRDNQARSFNLYVDYSKPTWNTRYNFDLTNLDNDRTGLRLEQVRHDLRAGYFESWWENRWSFSVEGRVADVSQQQDAPSGTVVALPVAAVQGLFVIDSTPALAELEAAPQLIDGNTTRPAAPAVAIGGANTFRNIGVDLGISRPVSELEVSVDAPSGPVIWQVWQSPDNSSWFQIDEVTSAFDTGFLRYTIRFPEANARFFKAVNVSVNPVPEVFVTEVRALRTTTQLERTDGSGSEYWLNLLTSVRPTERIEVSVGANLRRDQDLVATDLRRSYDERDLSAQLRAELARRLELRLGYQIAEIDENLEPVLERRDEIATATLDWRPLDTIGVLLTAQQREETDGQNVLSSTDSLVLRAITQIFPDLALTSTVGTVDTADGLFGFTQETRYFIETLEARPNDRWLLSGTFSRYDYDAVGRVVVTSRTTTQLRASWFATPFLSLNGEVLASDDDLGSTDTRRWGLQWAPGPKLSLGTNYYDTESSAGAGTANFSLDGSYRLNSRLRLWLALNEAESRFNALQPAKTEALRLGLIAIF